MCRWLYGLARCGGYWRELPPARPEQLWAEAVMCSGDRSSAPYSPIQYSEPEPHPAQHTRKLTASWYHFRKESVSKRTKHVTQNKHLLFGAVNAYRSTLFKWDVGLTKLLYNKSAMENNFILSVKMCIVHSGLNFTRRKYSQFLIEWRSFLAEKLLYHSA